MKNMLLSLNIAESLVPVIQEKLTSILYTRQEDEFIQTLTEFTVCLISSLPDSESSHEEIKNEISSYLSEIDCSRFASWLWMHIQQLKGKPIIRRRSTHQATTSERGRSETKLGKHSVDSRGSQVSVSTDGAASKRSRSLTMYTQTEIKRTKFQIPETLDDINDLFDTRSEISSPSRSAASTAAPQSCGSNFEEPEDDDWDDLEWWENSGDISSDAKYQIRCRYWPYCERGKSCWFVHPVDPCPNEKCQDPGCLYYHEHRNRSWVKPKDQDEMVLSTEDQIRAYGFPLYSND